MIILTSPSKTLDPSPTKLKAFSQPEFLHDSELLVKKYRESSPEDLANLMKINSKLAEINYARFQAFHLPFNLRNSKQAIIMFAGSVYKNIDVLNYNAGQITYMQNHLRILSGLYGMLRPLDLIQPYRLEMQHEISFWKKRLSKIIEGQLIVNLASQEYFQVVQAVNQITPVFKQKVDEEYRTITIYAKQARGIMINWMIKNKITNLSLLKTFAEDSYKYSKAQSNARQMVFIRG